ncbi:MAG: hopanoid biosynthesis-associated protein HpnK [Bacillota bacterium]
MVRVIINADDFGRSKEINRAVARGYHDGVLTSASLMVAGVAAEEAVRMAREMPGLAVGLHVVVVDGRAVLPAKQIGHLVNEAGWFPNTPVRSGLRYSISTRAKKELWEELQAQFERFAATGLPMAHVDGHQHMHVHPTIFGMVLELAERYGAKGIRLPRDEMREAWRGGCGTEKRSGSSRCSEPDVGLMSKVVRVGVLRLLAEWCAWRMQGTKLAAAARTYGVAQSGAMEEGYVLGLLQQLRPPTAEICFHPTVGERLEKLGANPGDLQTLLSPAVKRVIAERGLRLSTYLDLNEQ